MPLDVGESINYLADAILTAPAMSTIARNPIYTAMLITFIIVLIIMFIFRNTDTEESLLVMSLRSGFWIFLMMVGVLFIHNKVLTGENVMSENKAAYGDAFKGGYSGLTMPGQVLQSIDDNIVPVHINTDFTKFT